MANYAFCVHLVDGENKKLDRVTICTPDTASTFDNAVQHCLHDIKKHRFIERTEERTGITVHFVEITVLGIYFRKEEVTN